MKTRNQWVQLLQQHAQYGADDDDRLWVDVQTVADLIVDNWADPTSQDSSKGAPS